MNYDQLKALAKSYNCSLKALSPHRPIKYEGENYTFVLKADDEDEADDFINDDRNEISSMAHVIEESIVTYYLNFDTHECENCGVDFYGKEEYHRCK
jgi:hypothetical protein